MISQDLQSEEIRNFLVAAEGQPCWYVGVGGCTGPSFSLSIGSKQPRQMRLNNPAASEDFSKYYAKYRFLIWCTWRLECGNSVIASSDSADADIVSGIRKLVGKQLQLIEVDHPAFDLTLKFSGHFTMRVFCDHTESDPSFDGNWEAVIDDKRLSVGPGTKTRIQVEKP